MEKNILSKQELIDEILTLIDNNKNNTLEINTNYIDYFELDELIEMRDILKYKKNNRTKETSDYLDDIFSKCST